MNFDGTVIQKLDRPATIAPLSSRSYFDVPVADLLKGADPKTSFVYCELMVGGKLVSSQDFFFAPFKELRLPKPAIIYDLIPVRNGFRLTVKSDKFAKALYMSLGDAGGSFTDNYFDVVPGNPVVVEYQGGAPLSAKDFRERLSIRSMVDAF